MISALTGWLSSALSWLGNLITSAFSAVWGMVQGVVDVLGAVLVTVLGNLVLFIFNALMAVLGFFTGLLPTAERPADSAIATAITALDQANRYVPVAELLLLIPVWSAVFLGVVLYKAWKALPLT